ncbi:MAG TPA: GYF domain-containing protein [Vicinamibacterales bacterium]|jgi:uncharacterized membrane protein|nr:GYF domain-containing protein [Vicinamibacterales bacterium]
MYYVIAADGKMIGPLTVEDVHQWLAEGRASKFSRVRREGETDWQALGAIPELMLPPPQRAPETAAVDAPVLRNPDAIAAAYLERGVRLDAARCVSRGWALVRQNPVVLISAALVVWAIIIALTFVPRVGWLAGMVVNSPLLGGLYYLNIRRIRGERAGADDAFAGFRPVFFMPLLIAGLLSGALTTLGILLLVLPGVYLAVGYIFVLPLVIDKRMDVWTAMEVSRRVVHQQWWMTFALAIVAALMVLAGALAFGVGVVIAVPVATAALMYAYDDLFGG